MSATRPTIIEFVEKYLSLIHIFVMNTPGQNSNAVAELAIAMMIYMYRNQFTPATGSEIQGKKVGIQAFGNVGRLVAVSYTHL